jgi:hypothetical protein
VFGQVGIEMKFYLNWDFYHLDYIDPATQQIVSSPKTNKRLSIAAALHTLKNYRHELELFIPEVESKKAPAYPMNYEPYYPPSSGFVRTFTSYSFRYEFSKEGLRLLSNQVIFALGAGINPYYTKTSYLTQVSNFYNRYVWESGAALNFIPRVILHRRSSKLAVEFSIPLKVYDARYIHQKIENPAIPISQADSSSWKHIFFESAYTLRLGISFWL